jgi:hypothetical protein
MSSTATDSATGRTPLRRAADLRAKVIYELQRGGFDVSTGLIQPPSDDTKDGIRALHANQRRAVLERAKGFIAEWEDVVLDYFADGTDVDPANIAPAVRPVTSELDASLYRYATLLWTVPVSQGYGRRTRFLVLDQANGKLIGIFALGDPVFNLRVRDNYIGWNQGQRQERLYNVFDAFVLGAVAPYRQLIAGKLVALCAVSNEVMAAVEEKYHGTTTVINRRTKIARPVLVTTTSALGRSSIYNRITLDGRPVFQSVGYTEGFGHFQFSDELFAALAASVENLDSFRGNEFGQGPNWKLRTIRLALERLDLDGDLLRHGIRREVYLAPVAIGWRAFLRGETDAIKPRDYPLECIKTYFRDRWAVPRAGRRPEFKGWSREQLRISTQTDVPMVRQPRLL